MAKINMIKNKRTKEYYKSKVLELEAKIASLTARDSSEIKNNCEFESWFRSMIDFSTLDQENFYVIGLNSRSQPLFFEHVGRGTLASVEVHPRDIFRKAVIFNAHSIIIAHNHPSGNSHPSNADNELTDRVRDCSTLLGIPLMDHIIFTEKDHFSYAKHGLVYQNGSVAQR